MNKKLVAVTAAILIIVIAVIAIADTFLAAAPASEIVYKEPASAVRVSLGKTATSDTISLRLNGITDGSNPATHAEWVKLNLASQLYNISLTPSPDDGYLVANVTVANAQPATVPFSYAAFALLTPNSTAYYANYAVCSRSCTVQALENQMLNANFTSDVYVLFSVPRGTQAQKVVYTTSNPPIVMSTT